MPKTATKRPPKQSLEDKLPHSELLKTLKRVVRERDEALEKQGFDFATAMLAMRTVNREEREEKTRKRLYRAVDACGGLLVAGTLILALVGSFAVAQWLPLLGFVLSIVGVCLAVGSIALDRKLNAYNGKD